MLHLIYIQHSYAFFLLVEMRWGVKKRMSEDGVLVIGDAMYVTGVKLAFNLASKEFVS